MIIFVILIAGFLRFWGLSSLPPALDWDEVSTAYNGYSIVHSTKDDFGDYLPILFRAYDGYVPPVLFYLNSLSTSFFGLSELGARFPNAFLGTLSVLGIYLVLLKISRDKKLALLGSLFLAISPWHILYSRVNTFAALPIVFCVFGLYFFIESLKKKRLRLVAILLFVLAVFSYFSAYVFVPLLAIFMVIAYWEKINLTNKILFLVPIIGASLVILLLLPGGQNRFRGISRFSDPDLVKVSSSQTIGEGILGKVLHNRRLVYGQKALEGYFANFHFDFLFGNADVVSRMNIGGNGFGLLYLWDLPMILVGIFYLIFKKPSGWKIFLAWLLIAPIASAVTLPSPASTRAAIMIPALVTLSAYGFLYLTKMLRTLAVWGVVILLLLNFTLFAHLYFVHFRVYKSKAWFWGYHDLFSYLNKGQNAQRKVHFVFKQYDALDQIHMFLLFYNKVDPKAWQANGGTRLGCLGTTGQFSFNRYDFLPVSCPSHPFDFRSFDADDLIVTNHKLTDGVDYTIYYLDGTEAFFVQQYKNNQEALKEFVQK